MNSDLKSLQSDCDGIFRGCAEAITWIKEVRGNSKSLEREAPGLIRQLRRTRNTARRLGCAAEKPMSIGFFGLSQAGKSYLISSLAAGEKGELETLLDGEKLNFIDDINPSGMGKEATGLVTRFTRHINPAPNGLPIQLTLFSEVDLVKILGNAFFNDFDRQQVDFNTDPEEIRKLLSSLQKKRQEQPTGGMDEDDVVDLYDYFDVRFNKDMKPLMGDYWPTVIHLAPYLQPNDRAALFAVLWGGIEELSKTYLRLRGALDTVKYADTIYCPLSALVMPGADGEWTKDGSIMDVTILGRLGLDDNDRLQVQAVRGGGVVATAELPRSVIVALTAEIRIQLAEVPVARMLETVDLLDFPGYRGRLKVGSMDDVRKALDDNAADPVAELLLRGKVAYLFERYTENQEMNVLVVCTPSEEQSNVSDMGRVLEDWINTTQGETPEERAGRLPGLVWAVTKFDKLLNNMLDSTRENMRKTWEGLTHMTMREKFGHYEWLQKWTPDQPFNNVFLTRKARMAWTIVNIQDGSETGINPLHQETLAQLKSTFLSDEGIQRHVDVPEQAWNAMLAFNDGGISRLAGFLEKTAQLESKLSRIRKQVDRTIDDLINNRLGSYYQKEGDEAVATKKKLVEEVISSLKPNYGRFGELLNALQLPPQRLSSIYLRSEEEVAGDSDGDSSVTASGMDSPFDLSVGHDSDNDSFQPTIAASSGAARFAKDVLTDWVSQLHDLPEHVDLLHFLGLPKKTIEQLSDELIIGVDRLKLEDRLIKALSEAEGRTSATRHMLVERQVLVVRTLLNDFVDYLGNSDRPLNERAPSATIKGRVLFEPPPLVAPKTLPNLSINAINYSAMFILDWFEAFKQLAIDNAGHTEGREITPQQNQRLGEVFEIIAGQQMAGTTQSGS